MKFYVAPTMSLFFMITIIFLRHPTLVKAQNDQRFQNCSATFNCGNISDVGFPFWGSNLPEYCGHPSFELNCTDQTAEIKIGELTYRVLEINSESQNLRVARTDYVENLCPEPLLNTTLDWDVLSYASDIQNISLYYGCPSPSITFPMSQALTFSCNSDHGFFVASDLGNSTIVSYTVTCTNKVIVQATQSAVQAFESSLALTEQNLLIVLEQGFGLVWDVNNSICEACTVSGGVCGYNSSASSFACYCSNNQTQPFSCGSTSTNPNSSGGTSSKSVLLKIGLAVAAATIFSTLLGCYYGFTRGHGFWIGKAMKLRGGKNVEQEQEIETFIMNYHSLMPKRYSYSEIKKMTNTFTEKLGQGGFGGVYKGKLSDGRLVAVKVLTKSAGDGEEFINEVASISRTSHVNIVTLLGFCYERTKRALIYEFMPNGSLEKFIYREGSQDTICHLDRKRLHEIAIGIARGLEYLHRGCNTRIVHFDIKPQNILLDDDFCPKIADFGLAKLCKGKQSIVSMLGTRGTIGYIAPEVFMRSFGGISYKSDVYSYGMMILEMFGGRNITDNEETQTCSEMYFPDRIYKHLEEGQISILDQNMTDEEEETVRKMIIVGMWCIQSNPSNRPSMTRVIEMLEGSLQFLQIPPKPLLFSTTKPQDFFTTMYLQSQTDKDTNLSVAVAESSPN